MPLRDVRKVDLRPIMEQKDFEQCLRKVSHMQAIQRLNVNYDLKSDDQLKEVNSKRMPPSLLNMFL